MITQAFKSLHVLSPLLPTLLLEPASCLFWRAQQCTQLQSHRAYKSIICERVQHPSCKGVPAVGQSEATHESKEEVWSLDHWTGTDHLSCQSVPAISQLEVPLAQIPLLFV